MNTAFGFTCMSLKSCGSLTLPDLRGGVRFFSNITNEARKMKLCTVKAYYVTSITKQLKFFNSHCSIVCSYCFVVSLIATNDRIFKFLKLNEIHKVDSPFNEDPKNMILSSRDALISGEGRSKNLGKWEILRTSIVMQIGGSQFRKRISAPYSLVPKSCDASIFLHARPNFRGKK